MIDAIFAKIFGTRNERQVKAMRPLVAAINQLEPAIEQHQRRRARRKTVEFKERLAQGAALDDLLIEAFRRSPRGRTPRPEHAAFRCPAHRRHRAAPLARSRDEDR